MSTLTTAVTCFLTGVKLFINPQALLKVTGTVLDYQEDEIGSQFVFDNPNAKGSCGCGESFYV